MDAVTRQSRTIERKLRDVQQLPPGEAPDLFRLEPPDASADPAQISPDPDTMDEGDVQPT
jgi:hypothetical protein